MILNVKVVVRLLNMGLNVECTSAEDVIYGAALTNPGHPEAALSCENSETGIVLNERLFIHVCVSIGIRARLPCSFICDGL